MSKYKRFYVIHFGYVYSLPSEGYAQFLADASQDNPEGWDLEKSCYEAKIVLREPHGRFVFKVTDKEPEVFGEELKYFSQHQDLSPWNRFSRLDGRSNDEI